MALASLVETPVDRVERCDACGAPLTGTYYGMPDRPERFCATCIATRPRCDTCSAPVGEPHWMLHDGRVQCQRCHITAVYEPGAAFLIYRETVDALVAQLGLSVREHVEFRLVDAPTMAQVRARAHDMHPGDQVLGLFQSQGKQRAIFMLYGLPRLLYRTVVAHEYAHAWQAEQAPELDEELREGFAEWVAYRHLMYLGSYKAAQRMLTSSHPYRPMLERVLDLDQRLGPAGVIDYVRHAGRG
jgi:hypothetical protein